MELSAICGLVGHAAGSADSDTFRRISALVRYQPPVSTHRLRLCGLAPGPGRGRRHGAPPFLTLGDVRIVGARRIAVIPIGSALAIRRSDAPLWRHGWLDLILRGLFHHDLGIVRRIISGVPAIWFTIVICAPAESQSKADAPPTSSAALPAATASTFVPAATMPAAGTHTGCAAMPAAPATMGLRRSRQCQRHADQRHAETQTKSCCTLIHDFLSD